jgi:hypothetical protein
MRHPAVLREMRLFAKISSSSVPLLDLCKESALIRIGEIKVFEGRVPKRDPEFLGRDGVGPLEDEIASVSVLDVKLLGGISSVFMIHPFLHSRLMSQLTQGMFKVGCWRVLLNDKSSSRISALGKVD